MNGRHLLRGLAALLILWSALACQRSRGPDVFLVTLDGVRPDRIGGGEKAAPTPMLDALAGRGVTFEQAYTSSPLTLPSHTTIHTGLPPTRHGVRDDRRFAVPAEVKTVAERLVERGYQTAAFVASAALDSRFGLDRGFETYHDANPRTHDALRSSVTGRRAELITGIGGHWLAGASDAPVFLWLHYADATAPGSLPAPFDEIADPYLATLAYLDNQLGSFVEALERERGDRERLILVVGSHGLGLGEHGEVRHGLLAYDTTLHVPLIVVGPGLPPGGRSTALVGTRDVAPTILSFVGLAEGPSRPGFGAPLGQRLEAAAADVSVGYFETFAAAYALGWRPIRGVRQGRWKYTAEPGPVELYDVIDDPSETRNRAESEPEVLGRMQQLYEEAVADERDPALAPVSDAVRAKLAALSGAETPAPAQKASDPRRFLPTLSLVDRSRGLIRQGRVVSSLRALEALSTSPVLHLAALQSLAVAQRAAGRVDDAIVTFARWGAQSDSVEPRLGLADSLVAAGRADDAVAILEGLEDPSLRGAFIRAEALRVAGHAEEAEAQVQAALAIDPSDDAALALQSRLRAAREGAAAEIARLEALLAHPPGDQRLDETRLLLAELLLEQGRDSDAVALLTAVPDAPAEHLAAIAKILAEHGRVPPAIQLYQAALSMRPAHRGYRRALADLYDETGRLAEALGLYDAMIGVESEDATLYVDRGAVRHRAGQLEGEEQDYLRALELDPTVPEVHFNLALIDREAGRDQQALERLLRAVELKPDFPKAHLMLAKIYGERGDPRAEEHAERAVGARSGGPLKIEG